MRKTPGDRNAEPRRKLTQRGVLTLRIISLLDVLRRSAGMQNKRKLGVSIVEWRIIVHVGAYEPLSLNDLAEALMLDRGQLSRAVKTLVARGLLDSKRKPGGPAIMITLSEQGDALFAEMAAIAAVRNQFLTDHLDAPEVDKLIDALDTILDKAHILLDEERAASAHCPTKSDEDEETEG